MKKSKPTAFENIDAPHFVLGEEVLEEGKRASMQSQRKRIILPIHRRQEARVQRMLNFLQPGTYIRPHKHPVEHAIESIYVHEGAIDFVIFDDAGATEHVEKLRAKSPRCLIDIEPGIWHTFLVRDEDTVLFETKKGPYDAQTDKAFAEWAPPEESDEVPDFMERLDASIRKFISSS